MTPSCGRSGCALHTRPLASGICAFLLAVCAGKPERRLRFVTHARQVHQLLHRTTLVQVQVWFDGRQRC